MINIDEYIKVCKYAKLIEVPNSKTKAFKSIDNNEGIELIAGKISIFKIIEMKDKTKEKVISEKVDSKEINSVLGAFEKEIKGIEQKPEQPIKEELKKEVIVSPINAIPEILEEKRIIIPNDIKAWKEISVLDRILLFQKTNKSLLKQRRGYLLPEYAGKDKKTLTDEHFKMFNYIPTHIMKQSANIAFLFEWSAVVESEKYFDNEISVRGYIQVEINGKMIRRPCGGSCVKKGMMDWGDTLEGAISEMEKRGIYNFLHGDVKGGNFDEII